MSKKAWARRALHSGIIALTGAIVAATTASAATVDENLHRYTEPQVNQPRTMQVVALRLQSTTHRYLTVDAGDASSAGAGIVTAAAHHESYRFNAHGGAHPTVEVKQPRLQWEWVPETPGATITGSTTQLQFGQLVNRQSGLCLDVADGHTAAGSYLTQWDCNGGDNQKFAAVPDSSGQSYSLLAKNTLQVGGRYLGINQPNCTSGEGNAVMLRESTSACTAFHIAPDTYTIATSKRKSSSGAWTDPTTYRCLPGYVFASDKDHTDAKRRPIFMNLGFKGGHVSYVDNTAHTAVRVSYTNDAMFDSSATGQVLLACEPRRGPSA